MTVRAEPKLTQDLVASPLLTMARVAARALLLVGSLDAFSDEFRMPDRPWWRGFDAEPRAAELSRDDGDLPCW